MPPEKVLKSSDGNGDCSRLRRCLIIQMEVVIDLTTSIARGMGQSKPQQGDSVCNESPSESWVEAQPLVEVMSLNFNVREIMLCLSIQALNR